MKKLTIVVGLIALLITAHNRCSEKYTPNTPKTTHFNIICPEQARALTKLDTKLDTKLVGAWTTACGAIIQDDLELLQTLDTLGQLINRVYHIKIIPTITQTIDKEKHTYSPPTITTLLEYLMYYKNNQHAYQMARTLLAQGAHTQYAYEVIIDEKEQSRNIVRKKPVYHAIMLGNVPVFKALYDFDKTTKVLIFSHYRKLVNIKTGASRLEPQFHQLSPDQLLNRYRDEIYKFNVTKEKEHKPVGCATVSELNEMIAYTNQSSCSVQ